MKVLANILLTFVSIPLLILLVFSVNIRFQFLKYDFWINTFEKGNIYQKISDEIKTNLESNAIKSGGKANDVIDLSSLISADNVEKFFDENIQSFLQYANGKSSEIMISFPFTNDLWKASSKIKLTDLLEEYNIETVSKTDIQAISKLGKLSWAVTLSLTFLIFLIIFLMYIFTKSGRHLVSLGISFTFSGVVAIACFVAGKFAAEIISRDFSSSTNIGKSLSVIIAAPVINNSVQLWFWFGISFLITGIILFFLKKPANNQK